MTVPNGTVADRQMTHLRTFQTSRHAKHSQWLLNELARARLCLVNERRRAEYDAELCAATAVLPSDTATLDASPHEKMSSDGTVADDSTTSAESAFESVFPPVFLSPSSSPLGDPSRRRRATGQKCRGPDRRWIILTAGIALVVMLTALLAIVLAVSTSDDTNLALEE